MFLFLISDIKGNIKPSEIPLHSIPFRIRVYDRTLCGRHNVTNAKSMGNKVGEFIVVDTWDVIDINKSMRIQTLIDARKSLIDKIDFKVKGGGEM